ncbi:MAG: VanZ family protein [Coriobacteriia bacterium]|nr:VanZ family protein [Coriobacteriia bacterium]
MRHRIIRILAWILTVAWAGVIFAVSARPGSTLPGGYSWQGHLGEYFILGALLVWALDSRSRGWRVVAIALLIASAYGVSDEFHQRFVPLRNPDVLDWIVDTVGAALGAFTARAIQLRARRRSTQTPETAAR